MYEQKRKEVNKAAEKFEKQLKAAKKSGSKANTDKVRHFCLPQSQKWLEALCPMRACINSLLE
jgi:ATP-binding cassette subfamily F protein 1